MIRRKLLRAMAEIYKAELGDKFEQRNAKAGAIICPPEAVNTRLAEVDQSIEAIDHMLDGITPTSTNNDLRETMTSADFPYAITSFVSRMAIPGYEKKAFNFEPLVWNDVLTNFLPHNRYQHRGSLDDLELVVEKGRARPGSKDDATPRVYQVYRWEKQYDFSMEALINDDLAYFSDQAQLMGQAARRTLEKFVSRMYTNAVSIGRLTGFGSVLFSQNGRLTSSRVSEARMGFNQRVDARNQPINARLAYIVHHAGLVDTVRQIQGSELVPELATNGINVGPPFIGIEDPYITGTAPNLPWWGFTNWRENNVRPFVLARLQNVPGPRVIRKTSNQEAVSAMLGAGSALDPIMGDFDTGNIVVKVVDIFGTYTDTTEGEYFDYRGAYYSAGTAP
jgi:hypothetical protein